MRRTARVVAVDGSGVRVECEAPAGCVCGGPAVTVASLLRGRARPGSRIETGTGEARFAVGDRVTLTVADPVLLRLAARIYLPPTAGLLLGPLALRALGIDGDLPAALAALAGLGAGGLVARWLPESPPGAAGVHVEPDE